MGEPGKDVWHFPYDSPQFSVSLKLFQNEKLQNNKHDNVIKWDFLLWCVDVRNSKNRSHVELPWGFWMDYTWKCAVFFQIPWNSISSICFQCVAFKEQSVFSFLSVLSLFVLLSGLSYPCKINWELVFLDSLEELACKTFWA